MISIVIVSCNAKEALRDCLESIGKHCPDAEVIIVDNAGKDGSAKMVLDRFKGVTLVQLSDNRGFAGAGNFGIRQASGDYVVLLNSDTVLEDDSLTRCAAWMDEHPRVGACSPRLIGMDGNPRQCRYRYPRLSTHVREALRMKPKSVDSGGPEEGWIAGTALMIRREALKQLGGGLDDTYWMYWEDADFSARLKEAGWETAEFTDGHIRHCGDAGGGDAGGGPDAVRRPDLYAWYAWGRLRWFRLHRPSWEGTALWCLELADVGWKYLRGLIRPKRRAEWIHARALLGVLGRRLLGLRPRIPGS